MLRAHCRLHIRTSSGRHFISDSSLDHAHRIPDRAPNDGSIMRLPKRHIEPTWRSRIGCTWLAVRRKATPALKATATGSYLDHSSSRFADVHKTRVGTASGNTKIVGVVR